MRQRWLVLALVFSGMVNVAAIGTIGYHWGKTRGVDRPLPPLPPRGPMLGPLRRALSLSPAQMQELDEQRRRTSEEIRKIRRDLFETRTRLMQLLRSPNPDSTAVEEILQEMASSQVALERKVVQIILRMRPVLTPEQREELFRMMERRFRRREGGPGWGPKMRRGPLGRGRG